MRVATGHRWPGIGREGEGVGAALRSVLVLTKNIQIATSTAACFRARSDSIRTSRLNDRQQAAQKESTDTTGANDAVMSV